MLSEIERYGTPFIATFFSRSIRNFKISLRIGHYESMIDMGISRSRTEPSFGSCRLGFEKGAVVIEAIQGGHREDVRSMNRQLREPWPNVLLRVIENQARNCGYAQVKIRRPETLHHYTTPVLFEFNGVPPLSPAETREKMKQFYAIVAKKNGYRKEKEFFVKTL